MGVCVCACSNESLGVVGVGGDAEVEVVSSFTYLGSIIHQNGVASPHQQ